MYKLSGHSLTRGEWFEPETQPMILQERDSTCSITLGPDALAIAFDDWLLDDEWPDGPYVWRVKGINDDAGADTKTVELEHVIKILDDLTLGEVTVEDIAGSGATTCSAQAAAAYILSKTSSWTLGDFEYGTSNPYEFNGETLYDALETVTDTLDNAVWEYDLSVYPFKVHIRQRDNAVRCEMRGERNLSSLKRSVSRSGMYTRIYPTGKNDLHIDGDYLSKNEGLYGRVDHRETDQSKSTKENLQAWAQGRLNRHCEPTVSITITGLELSQETGETLDNLKLNKICQVPLPEYATTITERIVKKQWRDRRKEPENVTLTLANNVRDISSIVKEQTRGGSGGRAGAGQAKQNYLFEANGEHLLYEVFDECGHVHGLLRMTSESLRIAFENLNDSTRSEFMLTAESLRIQFENEIASTRSQFEMTSESLRIQFENELASTRSEMEMTAESLRIEFQNADGSLRSEMQMTAESLRIGFNNEASSLRSDFQLTASSLRVEFQSEASSMRSLISANASAISLKVSKGDVSTQLAVECGNVTISGGNLVVDGYVTATGLSAAIGALDTLVAKSIVVSNGGSISTTGYVACSELKVTKITLGGSSFTSCLVSASVANNTLTLTDNAGGTTTFSKATTLMGGWSGGKCTVTADPQGTEYNTQLSQGDTTWDENTATVVINAHDNGQTQYKRPTGATVTVDATARYNAGVTKGHNDYTGKDANVSTQKQGKTWYVVFTRNDDTTQTLEVDMSAVYTKAREGYTLGTFALASVTLEGQGVSIQEIGTAVYFKSESITPISGNGYSVTKNTRYLRKTSGITALTGYTNYNSGENATLYKRTTNAYGDVTYTSVGYYVWRHSGSTSTLYESNGSVDDYCVSSGANGKTLYEAGSAVTRYEKKDSGGSGISTYYNAKNAQDYYRKGSTVSDTYYTKS